MFIELLPIIEVMHHLHFSSILHCCVLTVSVVQGYIDVGGGLGIDYDGSKGHSSASANYTMQVMFQCPGCDVLLSVLMRSGSPLTFVIQL